MTGYIDNVDFINIEAEKYWQYPATYKGDKNNEIRTYIFSGEYMGARKMDGCYYRFVKDEDGNCFLIAREKNVNGEATNKYEWIPQCHEFFDVMPNGTCFLGEVYFPNNEGSRKTTTIMGCSLEKAIQRQNSGDKLHYYIFDAWALDGKNQLNTPAETRFNYISSMISNSQYIEFAHYYSGNDLWEELQKIREIGGEGVVITKRNSHPEPGKRTARKTLKVKKELDTPIDCFLTGKCKPATRLYNGDHIELWPYWENIKTGEKYCRALYYEYQDGATIEPISKAYYNNWASAIELGLLDGDKVIGVGWISGITEDVREGIVNEREKWKHRVVKVNAMDIEKDTHHFRHARIIEWRNDKPWTDCTIDQLF